MYSEIWIMCSCAVIGIIVLFVSKFVRTVCREAISHPRASCEIQVQGKNIAVKRYKSEEEA
jgi:hypothetical protein